MRASTRLARSIRSKLSDVDWSELFTSRTVLEKLAAICLAAIIVAVGHHLGSGLSRRIDAHMRRAEQERLKRRPEKEADITKDDVAFRSRSGLAAIGGRVIYAVVMILAFLLVLRVLGLEIATIVAMLSTVGFVVGFAVQGTLSDLASGVLLALFQTYEVDDIIRIGDREGRVVDFRMVNTVLQGIPDATLITVPNRLVQESVVVNYSRSRYHYYVMDLLLSNRKNDYAKLVEILERDLADAAKYPEILRHPDLPVSVGVNAMDVPGTVMRVGVPIVTTPDINGTRTAIRTRVRDLLYREGVRLLERV